MRERYSGSWRSKPLVLWVNVLVLAFAAPGSMANEPVLGRCDGCENVFVGIPKDLESESRIAPADASGEPLTLEGTVQWLDGKPAAGIIVYAYQTDKDGIYPAGSTRHGSLRGWARTDDKGHYRFDTIRPGAYPNNRIPQHIHMHVIEPERVTYYIADVHFTDDPYLSDSERRRGEHGRGGSGIITPKQVDGVWHAQRDITLGLNVPDYPEQ